MLYSAAKAIFCIRQILSRETFSNLFAFNPLKRRQSIQVEWLY